MSSYITSWAHEYQHVIDYMFTILMCRTGFYVFEENMKINVMDNTQ